MALSTKLFELLGIYTGPWTPTTTGTPGNDDIAIDPSLIGLVSGGDGNDRLKGNSGIDTINGGNGSDQIEGGAGNDLINGGAGNDYIEGGPGLLLFGDALNGGEGTDTVSYEHSNEGVTIDLRPNLLGYITTASGGHAFGDLVKADFENVVGSNRPDTINGTEGANVLAGLAGRDLLYGNGGDDILIGGAGTDTLDGGTGFDLARYDDSPQGVTIHLAAGTGAGGEAEGDTLISIEGLVGSAHDDVLDASGVSGPVSLDGNGGNDILIGGDGGDTIFVGPGRNDLQGGAGDDNFVFTDATFADGSADPDNPTDLGTINGDDGDDGLDFSRLSEGITITAEEPEQPAPLARTLLADTSLVGIAETGTAMKLQKGNGIFAFRVGSSNSTGSLDQKIKLTNEDDVYQGNSTGEEVSGLAGNDLLNGNGGWDFLEGNGGNDTLNGGEGEDLLDGGEGDDLISGGTGADSLIGGGGIDTVIYTASQERVTIDLRISTQVSGGEARGDKLGSIENVTGSSHNDGLIGNQVANVLDGGDGDDIMDGLGGDDTLIGGAGADKMAGQTGIDTLDYSASPVDPETGAGVSVSLLTGVCSGNDAEGDSFLDIENVTGSQGDDALVGSSGVNVLKGLDGDDTFESREGADTISGGSGTDTINYAELQAGLQVRLQDGFSSEDARLISIENVIGTQLADTIFGSNADNELSGLGGDDHLYGGLGDDRLFGGNGIDTLEGGDGGDNLEGGGGADTLLGGAGDDQLFGDAAADRLEGGEGDDTLVGGSENDTLLGGGGEDYLIGGAGQDDLSGGADDDLLEGAEGNDTLNGGMGDDFLQGGNGWDTMNGGAGSDSFVYEGVIGSPGNSDPNKLDRILSFVSGEDKIDLEEIDADTTKAGDQAFQLIGGTITGPGQLSIITGSGIPKGFLLVGANVNGNLRPDFAILVQASNLSASDFIL